MKGFAIGVLGVRNLSYEVNKHWFRPRSFRVIFAVWLLEKHLPYQVTTKRLAKLYGVKTFSSDASLRNAVDSGYLHKTEGDKGKGSPRYYYLSQTGKELMQRYFEQCQLFEQRFNNMVQEYKALFDYKI